MPESQTKEPIRLVPEALLAAAKDARYIHECRELVQQVLNAFGNSSDDHIATTVGTILYSLLVLLPRGKTLGMKATGLQFDSLHYRLVTLTVSSSLAAYVLNRIAANDPVESLRGASRRDVYVRQREAMLGRSQSHQRRPESRERSILSAQRNRIKTFLRTSCAALFPTTEGPHFVESNAQRSWFQWLLRVHLAFYCMHGRYASWMHRLVGISYQQSEAGKLVSRPTTYSAVGVLLLSHAAGTGVLSLSRKLIKWWIDFCRPMIRSTPLANNPLDSKSISTSASSFHTATCAICHGHRTYPACPVDCGHVFCWNCLQKWVQTVRPECPICRTPCSASVVIPLYNYEPSA